MNEERIQQALIPGVEQGADVVVLGCTHYHWIENEINRLVAGRATIMQPEAAVIEQLKRILG